MAIKIDRFNVKNQRRGAATVLAGFDVNFGPMTIRGFEIVEAGGKRFISVPANVYEKGGRGSGDWDRYNYIVYSKGSGENLENEIRDRAFEELQRRSKAVAQPQGGYAGGGGGGRQSGYGNQGNQSNDANSYDPFAPDDDLPF